jgi:hypothetical protein
MTVFQSQKLCCPEWEGSKLSVLETDYGIEPKTNLAQLPNGVETRSRHQPTQPV